MATGKLTAHSFGVAADDWNVLQTARPNILLIGSDAAVAGFLQLLLPLLKPPIVYSSDGTRTLPASRGGTLILRDVPQLGPRDQQRLSDWLAGPEQGTQVVSTSSCSLYPMVERNALSAPLYYCLNVITLGLTEPDGVG